MLIANQLPPTKLLTAWDRDKAGKVDNALRKRNYLQRMKGLCDFGDGVDLELWDHRVHAGHLSLARAGHLSLARAGHLSLAHATTLYLLSSLTPRRRPPPLANSPVAAPCHTLPASHHLTTSRRVSGA